MDKLKKLPESELEIMLIIWERQDKTTTSDIMARVGKTKKVQLVQNYLSRLEEKGFIKCEKIGRLNHYTPVVDMEEYRAQETSSFMEKFYMKSPTKLLAALVQSRSIDQKELDEMKSMLERIDE